MTPQPTKHRLRAILGCAVSSPEQAEDEKQSLETQERLLREKATAEGWEVVDVLVIPGFSRRYYNWPEFAADALRAGIDAPTRLMEHWRRGDFDVLAWRYGSRFAREQSIFGEVVARTIDGGGRVYTLQDGWIDRANYRMFIAMGGYTAATEIDKLVAGREEGMKRRAERGLRTGPSVIFSHLPMFDAKGKEIGKRVDESKRRLWDDVLTLLLEGVPWNRFEIELLERFGHAQPDGRPYFNRAFYDILHTPTFWGHTAWNYRAKGKPNRTKTGFWVFEEGRPVPEGVHIYYHTHEPVYTGEQADRAIAELKRRGTLIRGGAAPAYTSPFSGLLVCAECGYLLSYHRSTTSGYVSYRCMSRFYGRHYPQRAACTQRGGIAVAAIRAWLDAWMQPGLESGRADMLFQPQQTTDRPAQLAAEIDAATKYLRGLIKQRADVEGSAARLLADEIRSASSHLDRLEALLADERAAEQERAKISDAQQQALEYIRDMPDFWEQDTRVIHQYLAQLFGDWRMMYLDKQILGVEYRPPHRY
jgi:DNA invertase Pin-like site-specific DNA recombinase